MNSHVTSIGAIFILVFIILSPSYAVLPEIRDYFDNQRILELLIIFLILIWALLQKNSPIFSENRVVSILSGILVFILCISTLISPSPRHASMEISLFAGLFYLSLFTAYLWKHYRYMLMKVLINAILLGASIYTIGFFAGYMASFLERIPLHWPEPFHGFTNLRFFNQYQLWTVALMSLPLLAFELNNARIRILIFIVIACWWMMLFASAGRGVMLSLLFALIATTLFYKTLAGSFLRIQMLCLTIGWGMHTLLFRVVPLLLADPLYSGTTLTGTLIRFTTTDRLTLWRQALAMVQKHPFFGVGPMHYAWYPNDIAAHPHNSVLQLAAEWGLPATFLVLSLSAYGIHCWLKKLNAASLNDTVETHRHLPIVLFFTLVANICYSLVDGVIVMPMSQVMMAIVIGLMLGIYSDNKTSPVEKSKIGRFILSRVFAGIVLTTLIITALPDALPRLTGKGQLIEFDLDVQGPRFWHNGGISR